MILEWIVRFMTSSWTKIPLFLFSFMGCFFLLKYNTHHLNISEFQESRFSKKMNVANLKVRVQRNTVKCSFYFCCLFLLSCSASHSVHSCMSVYRFKLVRVRLSDSYDLEKKFSVVLYVSLISSQLSSNLNSENWRRNNIIK